MQTVTRNYLDIIVPWVEREDESTPQLVTIDSPLEQRQAVHRIAHFFRREGGYDFVQYESDTRYEQEDCIAYLFLEHIGSGESRRRKGIETVCYPCIGAACFRYRNYQDVRPGYALQWVWIHPYRRRHGLLKAAWPTFKREVGTFMIESPLSDDMCRFLDQVDKDWYEDLMKAGGPAPGMIAIAMPHR